MFDGKQIGDGTIGISKLTGGGAIPSGYLLAEDGAGGFVGVDPAGLGGGWPLAGEGQLTANMSIDGQGSYSVALGSAAKELNGFTMESLGAIQLYTASAQGFELFADNFTLNPYGVDLYASMNLGANGTLAIQLNGADGGYGAAGEVLTSNGATVYWAAGGGGGGGWPLTGYAYITGNVEIRGGAAYAIALGTASYQIYQFNVDATDNIYLKGGNNSTLYGASDSKIYGATTATVYAGTGLAYVYSGSGAATIKGATTTYIGGGTAVSIDAGVGYGGNGAPGDFLLSDGTYSYWTAPTFAFMPLTGSALLTGDTTITGGTGGAAPHALTFGTVGQALDSFTVQGGPIYLNASADINLNTAGGDILLKSGGAAQYVQIFTANSYGTAGDYLTSDGTNTYWKTPVSDERLKTINGKVQDATEMVRQMEPIQFEWNRDKWSQGQDGAYFGFSAQNLSSINGGLVQEFETTDGDTYLKIRGKDQLLAIVAQAVKEIDARLTEHLNQ